MIGPFEKLVFDIRDKKPDIQVFVSAIVPRDVNLFPGAVNKLKFLHHENTSCSEDPLTPHFYIVKMGFSGGIQFFLFLL